ncbi:hypothetical protein Purlil1_5100 [Purpureocillium lilacinum]|uniref:Uncharacterized protein n=1 Tax=Purpureocillium lilacinum TaxID=33203 RepID=A0ABR0C386_PURLI|nr:hypothetical protein Purlil1_5100 [Purpureocillium lilacinum]
MVPGSPAQPSPARLSERATQPASAVPACCRCRHLTRRAAPPAPRPARVRFPAIRPPGPNNPPEYVTAAAPNGQRRGTSGRRKPAVWCGAVRYCHMRLDQPAQARAWVGRSTKPDMIRGKLAGPELEGEERHNGRDIYVSGLGRRCAGIQLQVTVPPSPFITSMPADCDSTKREHLPIATAGGRSDTARGRPHECLKNANANSRARAGRGRLTPSQARLLGWQHCTAASWGLPAAGGGQKAWGRAEKHV